MFEDSFLFVLVATRAIGLGVSTYSTEAVIVSTRVKIKVEVWLMINWPTEPA